MGQADRDPITSHFRRGRQLNPGDEPGPSHDSMSWPSLQQLERSAHNEKSPPKRGYDRRRNTGGQWCGPPIAADFLKGWSRCLITNRKSLWSKQAA